MQESNQSRSWDSVAAELKAYREEQREVWGDVDNSLLACYLCDELDSEDRSKVEQELASHPELQKLTDLVREVMVDPSPITNEDTEPAVEVHEPPILSFSTKKAKRPRQKYSHTRQVGALLAAACLLLALGYGLEWFGSSSTPNESFSFVSTTLSNAETRSKGVSIPKDSNVVASRASLHEEYIRGSLNLVEGDYPKALTQLEQVAVHSKKKSPELYSKSVDRMVQFCESAVEKVDRPRSRPTPTSRMFHMKSSNPKLPLPAPGGGTKSVHRTVPLVADHVRGVPSQSNFSGNGQPWVRKALPYVIEGFQQTDKPELRNRSAWALTQICPTVEKELSRKQRYQYRQALTYYQKNLPRWTGIRDHASLLSKDTHKRLHAQLHQLSKQYKTQIVAETVASLDKDEQAIYSRLNPQQKERYLDAWARRRARAVGAHRGVFVMVCMNPPTIQVTIGNPSEKNRQAMMMQYSSLSELWSGINTRGAETALVDSLQTVGSRTWKTLKKGLTALPLVD